MITITVDTDGVSGDYSTLSAAISALPASLTDDYTIDCYASTLVLDTVYVTLAGITRNGFTITINNADGNHQISVNTGFNAITISVDNTTLKGLIVDNAGRRCVNVTADNCLIDGCIAKADNGYSQTYGFGSTGIGTNIKIQNCIVYGYGAVGLQNGYVIDNGAGDLYNNIAYNCNGAGVYISFDASATIKNMASFNNFDDFQIVGSATIDYCASDDGDGTNAVTPADWPAVFTDYINFDFTLKSGSDLIGVGIGPSADPNVPVLDKAGNTRSGATSDIGAYLFVSGGIEINITATVSEPIKLEGSINQEQFISATVSEPIKLEGSINQEQFISATVSEPIKLEGSINQEQFLTASVAESIKLEGSINQEQFISATVSEPIKLEGSINQEQFLTASVAESISMTAVLTQEQFLSATIEESIIVTATLTTEGGKQYYELVELSFNIERSKDIELYIEGSKSLLFNIEIDKEVSFDI